MTTPDPKLQVASSNFNLQSLSPSELGKNLSASIDIANNVIVVGRRGSGKTQISKQRIKQAGMREVYINLSVCERTDMGGYPDMFSLVEKRGVTGNQFVNMLLPRHFEPLIEGDVPCIALLDEVDKADPSINAPLLEFTQMRSINGRKFKNLVCSIMTGNLISEGGSKPSEPLLDRAEKFLLEPNINDFITWGGDEGKIHASVLSFLYDHSDCLFGTTEMGENYADTSPRGWENVSVSIKAGEQRKWGTDLILNKVAGFVGKKASLEFDAYYNYYQEIVPFVNKLMEGDFDTHLFQSFDPTKQLVSCMFVCTRFANELDKVESKPGVVPEIPECGRTVSRFLKHCSEGLEEQVLISMRTQVTIKRMLRFKFEKHVDWKDMVSELASRTVV